MTNRANEYVRQRPLLGAAVFVGMVTVGTLLYAVLLESTRSPWATLTDAGVWLTIALIALPSGLVYFVTARQN